MLRTKVASSVIWAASLVSEQPFPERREPIHGGSGRDVLSRTAPKGPFRTRRRFRVRMASRPLRPGSKSAGLEPRCCGLAATATLHATTGLELARCERRRERPWIGAAARVSEQPFPDRARQDVAPGAPMDGFTAFRKGLFTHQ